VGDGRRTKVKTARAGTKKAARGAPAGNGNGASTKRPARSTPARRTASFKVRADLPPRSARAIRAAALALWDAGLTPHKLLAELHDVMLLRCLDEAGGNFAAAAAIFGPSRQSVQQYANSRLRDERWLEYRNGRDDG
jgi:hypothetical protein